MMGVRPKTLIATFSPILLATAWVVTQVGKKYFSLFTFILAFISALSIQIATNFINDAMDFKKGADTALRVGPARLVSSGLASYQMVIKVAVGFLIVASLTGLPLVWMGGWPILLIGVVSLFLAYSYTAGPFPLAYLGLGELFVIIFFGVIPLLGMVYLYTSQVTWEVIFLGVLVGFHSAALILINNIRDVESDRIAKRKTLPIRFGQRLSLIVLGGFLVLPSFLSSVWIMVRGTWVVGILPLFVLPASIRLLLDIFREPPGQKYNEFLGRAGYIQLRWTVFMVATLFVCAKFGFQLTS